MEFKDFCLRLAKARANKNLSAYELSLRIGKHTSYIHKVESGGVNVGIKTILEICEQLEIEPKQLFE